MPGAPRPSGPATRSVWPSRSGTVPAARCRPSRCGPPWRGRSTRPGGAACRPDGSESSRRRYVAVAVTVRLRVPAALAAQVEQAATAALVELLHPTDGGPDGRGWPFGRRLWESDVLRTLDGVDGIDRVDGVELTRLDGRPLDAMPADGLVSAAAGDVDVQIEPVVEP